ncbi:hypothetical protein BC941DRAFT_415000 [Chlamydoabsidia padenii]|nr:hypothetical protein BC941DRAFT_415000 [Chlamydoabsidia padenii]
MRPDPIFTTDSPLSDIESRPSPPSRPPSYKIDHRLDLPDHHYKKPPLWRHQFHGTPLVFWLMVFVLVGTISLFIPQLPPIAFILWLPLLLYFIGILLVHGIYSRKTRALHQMERQLANIQCQQRLTHSTEYDNLYFLRSRSDQHSHVFTTLLPPPPSYQRAIGYS